MHPSACTLAVVSVTLAGCMVGPDFAPLDAFWSINNAVSSKFDVDSGEMPTSFYSSNLDSLFILGDVLSDTDEFDDHIIVHEWGHYFEDNFGRSDSVGGRLVGCRDQRRTYRGDKGQRRAALQD